MAAPSTRQELLSIIDDVEVITKELFEHMNTQKKQQDEPFNSTDLVDLLVQKNAELQATLKIAKEQGEVEKKYEILKAEVAKRDEYIHQLQASLKDAESILATAVYEAKQKLQSINQAKMQRTSSEELIKYAHRISASSAVAAPSTWLPGDPRRPYPTDLNMRLGLLGSLSDMPINSQTGQPQANLTDTMAGRGQARIEHSLSSGSSQQQTSLAWQPGVETQNSSMAPTSNMETKGPSKENEDVELMSSDSSSSSSSDE